MKLWITRDKDLGAKSINGNYSLYTEEPEIDEYWDEVWFYGDGEILRDLCPKMFKRYTGLKRHLKPGTKKLVEWTPPLGDQ